MIRQNLLLVFGLWLLSPLALAQPASLREAGDAVARRFVADSSTVAPVTYMNELAAEALLEFARATDQPAYRDHVYQVILGRRRLTPATVVPWQSQPFGCLTFALYEDSKNEAWLPIFREQSGLMRLEIWRDREGIVLHPRGRQRGGGEAVLIDAMQEYASRCCRMGALSGDRTWFTEAAYQFREYRRILRDPVTGLYSQGRGWLTGQPERLSPGAWSRGHGWLLRGMECSLRALPRESAEYREILGYFTELADALLKVQRPDGMWPCLLHRPPADSPPETSGTGMIAWHLTRAILDERVNDPQYLAAVRKAYAALPAYVHDSGMVLNTSPGPGPLESETPWLIGHYPPGDSHGTFALLYAASGEALLKDRR